jgi:hypothetical protein
MSDTNTVSPLRPRMIEDMAGRKLNPHTQRGHIYSCKRFAAWLKRSPHKNRHRIPTTSDRETTLDGLPCGMPPIGVRTLTPCQRPCG